MGNTFSAFRSTESYQFRDEMDSAREIYMQVDPRQALLVKPPDDEKVHVTVERGSGVAAVTSVLPRSIQIEARCETDCTLQVGQFYFPAWRVRTVPAAKVRVVRRVTWRPDGAFASGRRVTTSSWKCHTACRSAWVHGLVWLACSL